MARREPEHFELSDLKFIGEQDGAPERELKNRIRDYLSKRGANCRAYLARVKYSTEADFSVALCIGGVAQADEIASDVGRIFSEMFRTDEHLDVIHVSDGQEDELKRVATPFYIE